MLASTHPKVFCAGGNLAAFGDDASIVDKHIANIMYKLSVHSREEIAAWYVRQAADTKP